MNTIKSERKPTTIYNYYLRSAYPLLEAVSLEEMVDPWIDGAIQYI